MNPTVPQSWIDAQLARDPARAAADYLAQFRSDLEGFISRDAVMACVVPGLRERPPDRRVRHHAFVDPSGGRPTASRSASATTTSRGAR